MKVLIVGAGPSGLACATSILEGNPDFDVTVVDKKSRVGENPRCAGGISLWMAEKVGISISHRAILAKIRRVRIYAPNGDYWELKGDVDYGYVLDRELFEQNMAEQVERLGGRFVLKHLVSPEDLEFWQSQYDYIVGADGPVSIVRCCLGLPSFPPKDTHLGVQRTLRIRDYSQDTITLDFGEVAPKGYAWCFPAGGDLVRVGLGVPLSEEANAGVLLEDFIQKITPYHKLSSLFGVEETLIAKQIPTARMPETGVYGKILLVGDALPSTDPLTGGGICQGIASGKAAGRAVAEGDPARYDDYIGWLRKQNNRRYRLKNVLFEFNDEDLNELIRVMQGFRPKTMSVGKELRRAVIRLLLRKPRLLSKFFKGFALK